MTRRYGPATELPAVADSADVVIPRQGRRCRHHPSTRNISQHCGQAGQHWMIALSKVLPHKGLLREGLRVRQPLAGMHILRWLVHLLEVIAVCCVFSSAYLSYTAGGVF
jgi:hypothetical protein